MITHELLKEAYEAGIVKLVTDPDLGHGTVCQIGKYWLIFGGLTGESLSPEEYIQNVPEEDILREIMEVLDCFKTDPSFKREYDYYDDVLNEWKTKKEKNVFLDSIRTLFRKMFRRKADAGKNENAIHHVPTEALIKELIRRNEKIDSSSISCLLDNSGFFAYKLWRDTDIKNKLEENGYSQNDSNVGLVLNTGHIQKYLPECTDADWSIIDTAIWLCSSDLEKVSGEE